MCRPEERDLWSHVIVVTNRKLARLPFLEQVELVCARKPKALILREKDLEEEEYRELGRAVRDICSMYEVPCFYNTYAKAAWEEGAQGIQLSLWDLKKLATSFGGKSDLEKWKERGITVGCSVHSLSEALEARNLGADHVIAGHIYATDCKKGLPPRGTEFLREICSAVSLPVYGIGGIALCREQIAEVMACGARGVCIMSGAMEFQGEGIL